MKNIDLLRKICQTPGAPGFEQKIRALIINEVTPYADEVTVDPIGNVVALRKGKEHKKVMVAAHMDEISFMVQFIDDDGYIRFLPLGGFDPKTLTSQRVIVHGKKDMIGVMGSKPIHLMKPEERNKAPQISDFFIDLGMSKKEVIKYVSLGDPITRERKLIEMGDNVNSKSIDNRVSVFILIEALKELKDKVLPYDLYGVFTVQEEVGLRGGISATHKIDPDFGFGLDTTIAFDVPGAQSHEKVTSLGAGTAIKLLDKSVISDPRMVRYLKEQADNHNIKWQPEVLPAGGTDTAAIQKFGKNGAIVGAISIPTRHIHQVIEMANKSDIRNSIDLLKVAVSNLDKFDWSH